MGFIVMLKKKIKMLMLRNNVLAGMLNLNRGGAAHLRCGGVIHTHGPISQVSE